MLLYNKLSNDERAALIKSANEKRLTLSFYKYYKIDDVESFRNHLFISFEKLNILGRVYVADEGINAQLSIPANKMKKLKQVLDSITFLKNIRLNLSLIHI